jgi:hypothetical protein
LHEHQLWRKLSFTLDTVCMTVHLCRAGDTIDLASVASRSSGSAVLSSGNALKVVEGGSAFVLHLDPSQNLSGTKFVLSSDGSSGTDIMVVDLVSVTSGATSIVTSSQTDKCAGPERWNPQHPVRRHG